MRVDSVTYKEKTLHIGDVIRLESIGTHAFMDCVVTRIETTGLPAELGYDLAYTLVTLARPHAYVSQFGSVYLTHELFSTYAKSIFENDTILENNSGRLMR
jgi:hypothetical protein